MNAGVDTFVLRSWANAIIAEPNFTAGQTTVARTVLTRSSFNHLMCLSVAAIANPATSMEQFNPREFGWVFAATNQVCSVKGGEIIFKRFYSYVHAP